VAVTGGAPTRADRRLADQVEKRLAQSKTFDGRCVEVSVHGEDAFLRGLLPTLDAKVEAGLLASSVRGVVRVHNQIRIDAGE
jgi:osmotically-inducible protein OsmY